MERAGPVVILAALVVLAPLAGVPAMAGTLAPDGGTAPLAASPPTPTENSTARLEVPYFQVDQARFDSVRIGMAGTLQIGADDARTELTRTRIRRQFATADSVAEERSVIDRALIDLSEQVRALEDRDRAAIRAYSDGNISTETLVRRLARIDARARQLIDTLALVKDLTSRIPTNDFDERIRDLTGLAEPLRGPVRHRAALALSGDATATRIYAVGGDQTLVLSMLVGGRYVREATNWSNRNATAPPQLGFGDLGGIGDRIEELYPWVTSQEGGDTGIIWRGTGVWRFRARHSQGVLTAHVDATTGDVFREVQRFDVERMPSTMTVVRSGNGFRIELRRTYVGGPILLLVENAATDAVVNAKVTVGGYELGRIGADGVVRTIEPRPPYEINASNNGSSFGVTVEWPVNVSSG